MARNGSMSANTSAGARRQGGRPLGFGIWALAACLVLCIAGCRNEESEPGAGTTEASPPPPREGAAPSSSPASSSRPRGKNRDEVAAGPTSAGSAKGTEGTAAKGQRAAKGKGRNTPEVPPPAVSVVVPAEQLTTEQLRAEVTALRQEQERLRRGVAALTPREPYVLINTTLNRLSVRAGDEYILRDAIVSTGSNTELVEPNGRRRWFFSTPKGVHTVKKKMVAPVWVKPDWAFIEEGEPVPGAQAEARFEEGSLGRYALYFGNGYMIHGTLFQRFLGQSVTHGCVRVGDADLETVYQKSKVGTKIYIF